MSLSSSIGYYPKVIGESLGDHPSWPNNRDMKTVFELHEFNNKETLEHCPNFIELTALIPENGTMLDLGCGIGCLAAEIHALRPDIRILGASCHDIDPDNLDSFDRIYYGPIPENTALLKDYKGRIDLIVDTYGPMSFADNPVHVMLYSALLLARHGVFSSITSETNHQKSRCVLGTAETWSKVKMFIKAQLETDVTIIPSKIKSQVFQTTIQRDYIIRMKTRKASLLGAAHYPALCKLADEYIGVPQQGSTWWGPHDAPEFSIKEKLWEPSTPAK